MAYGGLRGAVAFCLAILMKPENCEKSESDDCELKRIVVTTTISVVVFTVFVQVLFYVMFTHHISFNQM